MTSKATPRPPSPQKPAARKLAPAPMPKPIVQRRPYPRDLNGPMPEGQRGVAGRPNGASSALTGGVDYYGRRS